MTNEKCPKCGSGNLERGHIGGAYFGYKSHKQSLFSEPVKEFEALVCLDCGYIGLYLSEKDLEKLKKKLKKL